MEEMLEVILRRQVQDWLDAEPRPYAWRMFCDINPPLPRFILYTLVPHLEATGLWSWRSLDESGTFLLPVVPEMKGLLSSWFREAAAACSRINKELLGESRTVRKPIGEADLARLKQEAEVRMAKSSQQDYRPSEMLPEDYYAL